MPKTIGRKWLVVAVIPCNAWKKTILDSDTKIQMNVLGFLSGKNCSVGDNLTEDFSKSLKINNCCVFIHQ